MENNEKILTPEERLKLIQEIANNGGLFGINQLLNQIAETKKQVNDEVVESKQDNLLSSNNTSIDAPVDISSRPVNQASIYSSEAIPLVLEDINSQREEEGSRVIPGVITDEKTQIEAGRILERKLTPPNPYSDSRTIIPGSIEY